MRPLRSRTRRSGRSPTHAASPSSAARARTAATGGSRRAFSARQGATRWRRTISRAPTSSSTRSSAPASTAHRARTRPTLIERINESGLPVLSVDLPSGVDASTGEIAGAAVTADVTVTFHGAKVGLAVAPGRFHAGRVLVADIGLDPATTSIVRATPEVLSLVPRRGARDSKFTAGSLLVVGGAPGTTGAAVLTATAALRADAGYVTLAVPADELAVAETLALEPVKRGFAYETRARDARGGSRARVGARGRPRARPLGRREGSRTQPARAIHAPGSRRRGRAVRARARRTGRRHRAHSARGRARPAARHRLGLGLRAPAGGRRPVRRPVRRRRRPQGRRHDRAGSPTGGRSSATWGRPRSRPRARATC